VPEPLPPKLDCTPFPGVLLVEAAAQLAGGVAQADPAIPTLVGLKLTAMRDVKIFGTARPGATILLEATLSGRLGGLVQAHATARGRNHLPDR